FVDSHLKVNAQYDKPLPALYGAYEVQEFTKNGTTLPPLTTDGARWRTASVNRFGMLVVRTMTEELQYFRMEDDPEKSSLTLTTMKADMCTLPYARPYPEHPLVEGQYQNEPLKVQLKKVDSSKSSLMGRGFHWINEYPFYR